VDQTTTENNYTTQIKGNSRIKYLDVPLMIQLQTGQFYLEAGPQASFLLSQRTSFHQTTTRRDLLGQEVDVADSKVTFSDTGNFKKTDMGYAAGLGFRSPNNMVSFGLRYSHGLSSIYKDKATDARTSLLQVSITSNLPFFGG
jgi:hypothetical protein